MYTRKHLTVSQADSVYTEALARLEWEYLAAHLNALMALDPAKRAAFETEAAATRLQIRDVEADQARVLLLADPVPEGEEAGHGGH